MGVKVKQQGYLLETKEWGLRYEDKSLGVIICVFLGNHNRGHNVSISITAPYECRTRLKTINTRDAEVLSVLIDDVRKEAEMLHCESAKAKMKE